MGSSTESPQNQADIFELSNRLGELVKLAVALRCELGTTSEEYSFTWAVAGELYDPKTMEPLNGSGHLVLTGMFPGLQVERRGEVLSILKRQVLLKSAVEQG